MSVQNLFAMASHAQWSHVLKPGIQLHSKTCMPAHLIRKTPSGVTLLNSTPARGLECPGQTIGS